VQPGRAGAQHVALSEGRLHLRCHQPSEAERRCTQYERTITPFGGNAYNTVDHEAVRQQVNTYIRTLGFFDGVIDFDAGITDGGTAPALQAAYAAWSQMDGLHSGPAGYRPLSNASDLSLFAGH
jgi:lysophospholipase L1-like esterase